MTTGCITRRVVLFALPLALFAMAMQPPPAVFGQPPAASQPRQPLWQSPTSGPPIDTRFCPAGTQAILHLRLSELIAHAESDKIVDALGPAGAWLRESLPKLAGLPLSHIEQLLIAFVPTANSGVEMVYVVRPVSLPDESELVKAWNNPARQGDLWVANDSAYYLRTDAGCFAMGPERLLRTIAEADGEPPVLRRELDELLQASDSLRTCTLLSAPSFWTDDAKSLLGLDAERTRDWLSWFFDRSTQGTLLSAHLADNLFVELRIASAADKKPAVLNREYRAKVDGLANRARQELATRQRGPHSAKVLARLPDMLAAVDRYALIDVDGRQVVLRAYLPAVAAHNLLLAGRLLLEPGDVQQSPANQPAPETIAQKLARRISIASPRVTLADALRLFGDEVGLSVIIDGDALKREGITKNQSFALDIKDLPATEVLSAILKKASPDDKLMFKIKGDALLITTKAALAESRAAAGDDG